MFPTLFTIGPVALKTVSLFLVFAFLWTGFILWKRSKEEHYQAVEVYDGFLLACVVGLISSRVGYVLINVQQFGWQPLSWLDIWAYPGFSWPAAVLAATLYLYRYALSQKWDPFEILDFWAPAVSVGLALTYVGRFFDGTGFGMATGLPWGVVFPGLLEPHHPYQLYLGAWYFFLSWYLSRLEYQYRTFEWYRYGKKTAQTGFLIGLGCFLSGVVHLVFQLSTGITSWWYQVPIEMVAASSLMLCGALMLYVRSGRPVPSFRRKQNKPKLEQFSVR